MKISELVTELYTNLPDDKKPFIRSDGIFPLTQEDADVLDGIKIIGIAGSRGKTTTALMVHEYLKAKGHKSMLYCSAKIDSPASNIDPDEASETPLLNLAIVLKLLLEALEYKPKFIVLEVHESAIQRGIVKDLPFTVRALTNIYKDHHIDQESSGDYVKNIKFFFKDVSADGDSITVLGLTGDINKTNFQELLKINDKEKFTYSSQYTAEQKDVPINKLDAYLYFCEHSVWNMLTKFIVKGKDYVFETELLMPFNAFNMTCAISILEALDIFCPEKFQDIIFGIISPGREEIFRFNNRMVMLDVYLGPALEILDEYKQRGEIDRIKVVTGASGTGFLGWDDIFSSPAYISERGKFRKRAMDYLKNYADSVILTTLDNANEDPLTICQELQGYLGDSVESEIVLDRKEAIKKAILHAKEGDFIFIPGRGNRNVLVEGETEVTLLKDSEVIKEVIEELKPGGF